MDKRSSISRQKTNAGEDHLPARTEFAMDQEAHRRLAEKMEAVGMLARGIAHDLNNILSGILGFASYLKAKARPGTDLYRDLSLIEQSGARAAELTEQLFLIARRRYFTKELIHINSLIKEVLSRFSRRWDQLLRSSKSWRSNCRPLPATALISSKQSLTCVSMRRTR